MSILGWVVLGLIAGFVASRAARSSGEDRVLELVLGVIGAMVGGFVFTSLAAAPVTGFDLSSMFVASAGAAAVLLVYRAVLGRDPPP